MENYNPSDSLITSALQKRKQLSENPQSLLSGMPKPSILETVMAGLTAGASTPISDGYTSPELIALQGLASGYKGYKQAEQSAVEMAPFEQVSPRLASEFPMLQGMPSKQATDLLKTLSGYFATTSRNKGSILDESDIPAIKASLKFKGYTDEEINNSINGFIGQNWDIVKNVPKKSGLTGVLPESAVELAANQFLATGQLPALGMGASEARGQILAKAAEINEASGSSLSELPSKRASFKADTTSLSQISKQRDMALAFEKTANKNLDLALANSNKVDRTGSPIINRLWLKVKGQYAGDKDTLAFEAAIKTAANEYAKVVTGQTGGAAVSDAARQEVDRLLNSTYNPSAFAAVVDVMKQEMKNREVGYDEQINLIKERLSGKSSTNQNVNNTSNVRIRVKSKANGQTGTILESDFNPSKYERI